MEVVILSGHENKLDNSTNTPDEDNLKNQEDISTDEEKKDLSVKKFSILEPIKGIAFAVIATVIFLGFPQVITYVFQGETYVRFIPTFDVDVIRGLWLPVILWCLIRIGIEIAGLIERRYTKRLATITIIGNVLATICGLIIFINPRIVYWEYTAFIERNRDDMAEIFTKPITAILDKPNLIILVLMIFFFVLEIVLVIRRSKRDKQDDDDETVAAEEEGDENAAEDSVAAAAAGDSVPDADGSAPEEV